MANLDIHCIFKEVDFFCFNFKTQQWDLGEIKDYSNSTFILENSGSASLKADYHHSHDYSFCFTGGLFFDAIPKASNQALIGYLKPLEQTRGEFVMGLQHLPQMPTDRYFHQSAILKDSKNDVHLMVFGGKTSISNQPEAFSTDVFAYNLSKHVFKTGNFKQRQAATEKDGKAPNDGKWETMASMFQARAGFGSVVCNEKLYVIGGICEKSLVETNIEMFNINDQSW
jgi:hypothetical protein